MDESQNTLSESVDQSTSGAEVDETSKGESKEWNKRVLSQLKNTQAENKALKEKLEEIESQKLLTEGRKDEYIKNLETKLKTEVDQFKNKAKTFMDKTLKSKFMSELKSVGCIDPETAYRISNVDAIKINEEFEIEPETLAEVIGDLQKNKSYLFQTSKQAPHDQSPSAKAPATKDIKQMSTDELKERVYGKKLF